MFDARISWEGRDPLVLSLGSQGALRWRGQAGHRIACQAGTLWISGLPEAGSVAERLLAAGQSLRLQAPADLVLSGVPWARIAVARCVGTVSRECLESCPCPSAPRPSSKCGSISPVPTAICP